MNDDLVSSIASILNEWNPLDSQAATMSDLEGYKYEAMDILSTIKIKKMNTEEAVSQVLTQAFKISLDSAKLKLYSSKIDQLFNVQ
jgi:hypothetical protein